MKEFFNEFLEDYREEIKMGLSLVLVWLAIFSLAVSFLFLEWFEQKLKQDTERTKNEVKLEKRGKE